MEDRWDAQDETASLVTLLSTGAGLAKPFCFVFMQPQISSVVYICLNQLSYDSQPERSAETHTEPWPSQTGTPVHQGGRPGQTTRISERLFCPECPISHPIYSLKIITECLFQLRIGTSGLYTFNSSHQQTLAKLPLHQALCYVQGQKI